MVGDYKKYKKILKNKLELLKQEREILDRNGFDTTEIDEKLIDLCDIVHFLMLNEDKINSFTEHHDIFHTPLTVEEQRKIEQSKIEQYYLKR